MLSLAAASGQVAGGWSAAAETLKTSRRLSADDARKLVLLDAFGEAIGNTDRHLYNVALFTGDAGKLRLAPAFDQLPMVYAPGRSGSMRMELVPPVRLRAEWLSVWEEASALAAEFWRRAAQADLEPAMRAIATAHAGRIHR